jgi:7-keto-8-aminopelargonate synthetase-like enzyme
VVGTLGKAFGTFGAFVAGSEAVIETLIQRARSYIYTTAPPPAVAAATRVALAIACEEDWRRVRLAALVARFRAGAAQLGLKRLAPSADADPACDRRCGRGTRWRPPTRCSSAGLWVTPIRPPTVPAGSARLRITFSAAHEDAHVDRLLDALAGECPACAPRLDGMRLHAESARSQARRWCCCTAGACTRASGRRCCQSSSAASASLLVDLPGHGHSPRQR